MTKTLKLRLAAFMFFSAVVLGVSTPTSALGEEDLLKSETTAWLLGLDPIPGDALFYAGKPIQGSINLIVGGTAIGMFAWGALSNVKDTFPGNVIAIYTSIPLYVISYMWDAIGGIHGVYEHNEKVEKSRTTFLEMFRPTVAVTENGAFVGGVFQF